MVTVTETCSKLYSIEYIVVFWLDDILLSTKTQRYGSYLKKKEKKKERKKKKNRYANFHETHVCCTIFVKSSYTKLHVKSCEVFAAKN
jgi:hypothetical protein